ncbi:hypothetical protein LJC33_04660 [Eubacteriales bacterium OttesenSCG-928-N13]|nr:hypothetical protein [Eubacteriales bacterium OttesenSCG-928-N13]
MKDQLIEYARSLGFVRAFVMPPDAQTDWRAHVDGRPELSFIRLAHDPLQLMPECRSVILLVWPYQPFELEPKHAAFSAYYIASNKAYHAAKQLGAWISAHGYQSLSNPNLPLKSLAERAGAGRYGKNGVIGAPDLGSRIALECVLTDAEMAYDQLEERGRRSAECMACERCIRVCPVGALKGDATVDTTRCLRALPMDAPYPEDVRPLIGASLLGCDLCQDCCPRNRDKKRIPIPDDVLELTDLAKLLAGDMRGIEDLVGKNYARKKRLQARACLIAANTGRSDLLPAICALLTDDSELVREYAAWAEKKLQ